MAKYWTFGNVLPYIKNISTSKIENLVEQSTKDISFPQKTKHNELLYIKLLILSDSEIHCLVRYYRY